MFFLIAGQSDSGNFQAAACPSLMSTALAVENAKLRTTYGVVGPDPLGISHFQGYSGAKSLFRYNPNNYIFRSGLWSIGLAISRPVLPKDLGAHSKAHREARDTNTIRNKLRMQMEAVEKSEYKHFRFEYVLNMDLSGFPDHARTAASVSLPYTSPTGDSCDTDCPPHFSVP